MDALGGATEQEQHSSTVTSASMLDSAGLCNNFCHKCVYIYLYMKE